jgi:hypothetical protein
MPSWLLSLGLATNVVGNCHCQAANKGNDKKSQEIFIGDINCQNLFVENKEI